MEALTWILTMRVGVVQVITKLLYLINQGESFTKVRILVP